MAKPNGSRDTPFARTVPVVLAGGMSTRMGTDKATLRYGDGTLLDHMISLVATALGVEPAEVRISGHRPGYRCIPDRIAEGQEPGAGTEAGTQAAGPLVGIRSVLASLLVEAPQDQAPLAALFVPVDMPLLSPETLRELVLAANEGAVAPIDAEMPMVCPVSDKTIEVALGLLRSPERSHRSVKGLLARLGAKRIALGSRSADEFLNANTQEDWRRVSS